MCLAQCKTNLLLLVFSSSDGQWRALTYDKWGAHATRASFQDSEAGLSPYHQFVHGCFCWQLHFQKLLLLDTTTMEFFDVNLPSERRLTSQFFIVEAADGALAIARLSKWYPDYGFFGVDFDPDTGDSYALTYSVLRNNKWHSEKIIPLLAKSVMLIGVAGGYLLIKELYTNSSQEEQFGYFTVDVKNLHVSCLLGLAKTSGPVNYMQVSHHHYVRQLYELVELSAYSLLTLVQFGYSVAHQSNTW
ncbi:hypothetical protein ZWY2020_046582 [Hordeum vulgare]|nr:hypothetical protein ZWY2020_046582 [Hordeum vulgare]